MIAATVGGCGTASKASTTRHKTVPSPKARLDGAAPAHIAVIVMENEESDQVLGSGAAPYINSLARQYAVALSMYAIRHPSLPNYLALTGGSTFGISSDCSSCSTDGSSIVQQLDASGISWKAYMEDLPYPCFTATSNSGYIKKHDPFVYYTQITRDRASCDRIVPLDQLAADERRGKLPRFTWITPNLCHDMHDCSVATGDRFLQGLIPPLLRSLGHNGLLFVTWDEGSSDDGCCRLASGGHILTVVAGPGAAPRARTTTPTDHYSLVQTIEDLLDLPRLREAGCSCTSSLQPLLAKGGASK